MTEQTKTIKKRKGLIIFFWILSISIMFLSIIILFTYPILGITWLIIGLLLLPPISNLLKHRLRINIIIKIIIITTLFIISLFGIAENKYEKANLFYDNDKFTDAIKKIKQIKPKNDDEKKRKNDLIELYSKDKEKYDLDKNKYYYDKGIKNYNEKNFEKAISIFSKIDENSDYYKKSNLIITNYNNEKQKSEDKINYEEAIKLFENKKYNESLSFIDKISNNNEYKNLGKILKNKINTKISEGEIEKKEDAIIDNKIPGLAPVDVYLNLENEGFTTKKSFSTEHGNLWQCNKKYGGINYHVGIFSFGASDVETISATATIEDVLNKNIIVTKQFLKYIGTIPYDGNNPEKVNSWIDENFNNNKSSIIISGVKFTIYVPSKFARMLEVEKKLND